MEMYFLFFVPVISSYAWGGWSPGGWSPCVDGVAGCLLEGSVQACLQVEGHIQEV